MALSILKWFKANWKPMVAIVALIGLRFLAWFAPQDAASRDLIVGIVNVLDLFGVATVPALTRNTGDGK